MHIDKKLLRKLFLVAGGCIVLAWILLHTDQAVRFLGYIWKLVSPFVAGAGIAFVFNVPMRWIEHHLFAIQKPGLRRTLAILITLALLVLLIAFVVELLIPQIRVTVESLASSVPQFIKREAENMMTFLEENPEIKEWVLANTDFENIDWPNLLQKVGSYFGNGVTSVLNTTFSAIGNITTAIVNTVISLVFSLYCLARKDILASQGKRIIYSLISESSADEAVRILRLTNTTFSNFISGQCLEAAILGCLFAVAMLIFRMPYIPLVSVIVGITALVPVVGAFVGCALGAFFILVNDPIQAVSFVAMFLVLQSLENNLIYPRVVGTSIGLPGMWVLMAVTVGGELMGIGGMFLMIPLVSVLYTLTREFTDRRLAQRNVPEEKYMERPAEMQPGGASVFHFRRIWEKLKEYMARLFRRP